MSPDVAMHSKADATRDPVILAACTNAAGHFMPVLQITQHLAQQGYDIWFLCGPDKQDAIEAAGARFIRCVGEAALPAETVLEKLTTLQPPEKTVTGNGVHYLKHWIYSIPSWVESFRLAMTQVRRENPDRELVMMVDCWVPGIVPLKLGAELPAGFSKLPKTLGLSVIPPAWTSVDQGLMIGSPLPFDPTPASQARNVAMSLFLAEGAFKPAIDAARFMLAACGAQRPLESLFGEHAKLIPHMPWDAGLACHDTTLQMCIPSLEYQVFDFPTNFKFGGTLPPKTALNNHVRLPEWFSQVEANSAANGTSNQGQRRRIIAVAQGTIATDPTELLLPTLQGLSGRDDLLVVAILGRKGAVLPPGTTAPGNALVADYLPYDAVLQHADVFVANGGYGVFSHCVAHGVPMVLAGETEDKADCAMRGAYAGFAVNLGTQRPEPAAVAKAVEEVLREGKYKARAAELMKEAESFGALETVERELRALF